MYHIILLAYSVYICLHIIVEDVFALSIIYAKPEGRNNPKGLVLWAGFCSLGDLFMRFIWVDVGYSYRGCACCLDWFVLSIALCFV